MAHFAKVLDENVISIIVAEQATIDSLVDSTPGHWIQTSYNTYGGAHSGGGTPLRKNFAGIGFGYDSSKDAFIPPKPWASWTLDNSTCLWTPPVAHPDDGDVYAWNETDQAWDSVDGTV